MIVVRGSAMPLAPQLIAVFITAATPATAAPPVAETGLSPAKSADIARELMPRSVEVAPPMGFVRFCEAGGIGCNRDAAPSAAATPLASNDLLRLAKRVNRSVNNAMTFRDDRTDRWERPSAGRKNAWLQGDCEDYAIEKRARLISAGFPADRLFYAVGYRRSVGLHAVLVARIDGRDLVLDNRTPWVRPYSEAPYTWVAHQSSLTPEKWFSSIALSQG
jgi:predicted transglutaminase-like cysteine proteinase